MSTISPAVLFALLSLAFAGLLDVVYKLYSVRGLSIGMFVFGMGTVWGVLQLGTSMYYGQTISFDGQTLVFGLAAGILVTASNLLLIESLAHLNVSLGSTLYRLNTVGVVVLSFLFLAEPLSSIKLTGIGLAVVAALLLYHRRQGQASPETFRIFFWSAVLASLLRAGFGVVTKAGLSAGAEGLTMMLLAAGCWIVGGFGYAAFREQRVGFSKEKIGFSFLAGVLVYLIVNSLFAALARGEASVVVPIANLSFIVALSISVAAGMERFTVRKGLALCFAAAAIVLLAQVPDPG